MTLDECPISDRELEHELQRLVWEADADPRLKAAAEAALEAFQATYYGGATGEHNMRWLSELPAGWHYIYRAALARFPVGTHVAQAKEKFGTIRIYTNKWSDEIREIVDEAANASASTCAICGAPGKLRRGSWWLTTCEAHVAGYRLLDPDRP